MEKLNTLVLLMTSTARKVARGMRSTKAQPMPRRTSTGSRTSSRQRKATTRPIPKNSRVSPPAMGREPVSSSSQPSRRSSSRKAPQKARTPAAASTFHRERRRETPHPCLASEISIVWFMADHSFLSLWFRWFSLCLFTPGSGTRRRWRRRCGRWPARPHRDSRPGSSAGTRPRR